MRTEAKLEDVVRESASSPETKKEAEQLQRLHAQLEESLRNEERLRKQLEEVCLQSDSTLVYTVFQHRPSPSQSHGVLSRSCGLIGSITQRRRAAGKRQA